MCVGYDTRTAREGDLTSTVGCGDRSALEGAAFGASAAETPGVSGGKARLEEPIPSQSGTSGLVEYQTHYLWAVIIATLLSLLLVVRFFEIQIIKGRDHEQRARIDHITRERIMPRRGRLLDREGRPLAYNISEHNLAVIPHFLDRYPETLPRLRQLLGLTDIEYGRIAQRVQRAMTPNRRHHRLTILRDLVSNRCPHDNTALETGQDPAPLLWCSACGGRFEERPERAQRCKYDGRPLELSREGRVARCPLCETTYVATPVCPEDGAPLDIRPTTLNCPRCKRSFEDQVAIVKSHLHELPGLSVVTSIKRNYPEGFRMSHLLGYLNQVNPRDLERFPNRYRHDDLIGRAGLERALEGDPTHPFEPNLRGIPGEDVFFRDERGMRQRIAEHARVAANLRSTPAVQGDDVWLTIDLGVQRIVEQAMRRHPNPSGAAVVVDVHTGRILASYSRPEFDPNVWSGRLTREAKEEYDNNPYSPMMNKALSAFPPGSVWKVVTALAALNEGLVDHETTIDCPGHYDFAGRRFRCHDRSGHGEIAMVEAIKHSCDVYFYHLGEMLGMDILERYSSEVFGLGKPTGIEVGERTGQVPSKDWHRSRSGGWQPGIVLSTAVGQGGVLATPLQIARLFAALANGGRVLKTRLVLQTTDQQGKVRRRFMPEVERLIGLPAEKLDLVHQGLVATVEDDDGSGRLARLPHVRIAGKTGTAEAPRVLQGVSEELARWLLRDHAWFAAYAPAEQPQIAVVVFLEHGGWGGRNAAPIAGRIIDEFFRQGYGQLPTPEAPAPSASPDEDLDGIH